MAVSQFKSVEEMKNLVCERKLFHSQISALLKERNPNVTCGFSTMSVRRFCKVNGITRHCTLSPSKVHNKVIECASNAGESYGRKMLTGILRSQGLPIGERRVGAILREYNPAAQSRRKEKAGRSLNPKIYRADYFGHKVHIDQNEKLVMFGVVHVCARDGFSGKIIAHTTMPIKNNYVIYDEIYRVMLQSYGLWDQVRVDGGKEFALICHTQDFLRDYRNNKSRVPYMRTKSTENNIIERIWVEVNNHVNYPIKAILSELLSNDLIDMSSEVTKFSVSWVTCRVSKAGLSQFVEAWNNHTIPKRGKPNDLAKKNDHSGKINPNSIPTTEDAAKVYTMQTGVPLVAPHNFGTDLLEGYPLLQQRRQHNFYLAFGSDRDIFEKIMKKQSNILQDAISYFQNLTIDMQNYIS